MSDSVEKPWSDNPHAPTLSHNFYVAEKNYFAGALIGVIFYGVTTHVPVYLHLPSALAGYSRDCDHSVLPMHGCVAPSHPSCKGGRQVGIRGLHHNGVLIRDGSHRDDAQHEIRLLHQQPKLCWW